MLSIVCILPRQVSDKSNGTGILCTIYSKLNEYFRESISFLACEPSSESHEHYSRIFGSTYSCYRKYEINCVAGAIAERPFILIRPDDLEGICNPVHWLLADTANTHSILNILLAPPFIFSTGAIALSRYYSQRDRFLVYNPSLMPLLDWDYKESFYLEPHLNPLLRAYMFGSGSRNLISVYPGKGLVRPLADDILEMLSLLNISANNLNIIGRSHPTSKHELYQGIASSKLLISFDPFSHIERVSTLLGTPVLKPCRYNPIELSDVYTDSLKIKSILNKTGHNRDVAKRSYRQHSDLIRQNNQSFLNISSLVASLASGCQECLQGKIFDFDKQAFARFAMQHSLLKDKLISIDAQPIQESLNSFDIYRILYLNGKDSAKYKVTASGNAYKFLQATNQSLI